MGTLHRQSICFSLLLALLLFLHNSNAYSSGLSVELDIRDSNSLLVSFSLNNDSKDEVRILTWNTPLEEAFNTDYLRVFYEGNQGQVEVDYMERHVKRAAAASADFITLMPGESISTELNVAHGYAIDKAGLYSINFQSSIKYYAQIDEFSQPRIANLTSNSILAYQRSTPPSVSSLVSPLFDSCSNSEQSSINSSLVAAETMATSALSALTSTPVSRRTTATRFTTWFGSYQSSRYTSVTTNFDAIQDATANRSLDFVCHSSRCLRNVYAFVYTNKPYEIYLCDAFWSAPVTGTDSRAGTIVHELSHFNIVSATDDHAYGQSAVKQLAANNPGMAINNADSYEYFAENNPALSMSGGTTTTPVPDSGAETLTVGSPLSGSLTAGAWAYFEVTGATEISLYNLTADLDLYIGIGGSPTTFVYQCRPYASGTLSETCTISATGTTYIGVNAYASGSFNLIANGSGDGSGQNLTVGTPISGSLQANQWDYYQVTGATKVTLYNLSADLDLYIGDGENPTVQNYLCRPFLADTNNEACTISASGTTYIGVNGYAAGTYSLIAISGGGGSSNELLTLDSPVTGSLSASEWDYYQITGATEITLSNLTADLDLYIGDNENPTETDYRCRPYRLGTNDEVCEVSATGTTYIGVNAYSAGNYSLTATSAGFSSQLLTLGATVSGSLSTNEWIYYQVRGATAVSLFSLTANLDLYIGDGGPPTHGDYLCRPFSSGVTNEDCEVSPTGITYIGVNAFAAGSFSLNTTGGSDGSGNSLQTLIIGTAVIGSLSSGDWDYYQVSDATEVTLFNLSADLDLYVSTDGYPTLGDYTCRPYLAGSNTESCTITTRGNVIIAVNAYDSGTYSLVASNSASSALGDELTLELNQGSYVAGDPLVLTMNVISEVILDTYIGIILSTGELFTISPISGVSSVNTLVPYHTNLQVNGEQTHTVLNIVLPGGLDSGMYQTCGLTIEAGLAPADGNWIALHCLNFFINEGGGKVAGESRRKK